MSWISRIKWASLFALVSFSSWAQESYENLNRDIVWIYEPALAKAKTSFHTNIKPFLASDLQRHLPLDSIKKEAAFLKYGLNDSNQKGIIGADALVNFTPGFELSSTENQSTIHSGIGFGLHGGYKKWYTNINFTTENGGYPSYVTDQIEQTNVVPSSGYAYGTQTGYHHKDLNGYVSYSPSQYFNFQLGHGKNFWGDGYRSLLLSDVSNNYSYLKVTTTVWKLKYVNLFTSLKDINVPGNRYSDFTNKYATLHYLSYNPTKWLNLSLFETVVWEGRDTILDRGYDVNYLNPIIFYRPVEYSLGSSDNSLIGASFRIQIAKSLQLYGQLILDEFLLSEVKAGNGWWANKQGGQAGFKWFNFATVKGLHLQGEFNMVRPYTYSHTSTLQNYGHFNQPLAHPTGANFKELIGFLRYQQKKWYTEGQLAINKYGANTNGENYGQNIYITNSNRPAEYGHFIGQGNLHSLYIVQARFGYRLALRSNIAAEAGMRFYRNVAQTGNHNSAFCWIGLKTGLFNKYADY